MQGVCETTVDGTASQDIYARSDFKEFPRIDTGECTHFYTHY